MLSFSPCESSPAAFFLTCPLSRSFASWFLRRSFRLPRQHEDSRCVLAQRDRASRLFYFFPGRRADFIGFYLQAVLQFAVTENFDSREITADQLRLAQQLFVNSSPALKR